MINENKLKKLALERIHCCEQMLFALADRLNLLRYSLGFREYGFKVPKSTGHCLLDYCVFCGAKLPDSLRDEWFYILKLEYELEDPLWKEARKMVPAEFWIDEWWKKRGFENEIVLSKFREQAVYEEKEEWLIKIEKKVEEERRNYKGPHCCLTMDATLVGDVRIFFYLPQYREYQVQSVDTLALDYCPFCGKKEPQSLRKKWFEILKTEYDLKDPLKKDKKKVPLELWTDEWWKKRSL